MSSSIQLLPTGIREAFYGSLLEIFLYGSRSYSFSVSVTLTFPIGVFFPTYFRGAKVLDRKRKSGTANLYVISTFVALFVLVTMRFVLDTERTIHAFLHPDANGVPDYGAANTFRDVFTNSVWVAASVVADAFIIYRTWIIWNRYWLVAALPITLFLGTIGSGIYAIVRIAGPDIETTALIQTVGGSFILYLAFTLLTNVLCTGLIAFKIWTLASSTVCLGWKNLYSNPFTRAIALIIESTAIYTVLLLIQITMFSQRCFIASIFIDATLPVIGIVFAHIIMNSSKNESVVCMDTFKVSTGVNFNHNTTHTMQIHLEQNVHHTIDDDMGNIHSRTSSKNEPYASSTASQV
ncbi:hypothetical protein C8J56DRAFT_1050148 [Mycena floridula]|nr:hypothetical protein C8J56DRAFT_1050148 [Mycena floridula]